MSTITDAATTFTPTLLMVADSTRESTNKVHRLLGGKIAVTLGDPVPRTGTLGFLLKGEALKEACVTLHATGSLFQLIRPGFSSDPFVRHRVSAGSDSVPA